VFQACYANPHDHHPTHFRVSLFPLIHSPRCWQHARGLRLELAFLRPSVGNTLGGCASNWHSFTPALATRSGTAPRIGIPSPQLGGCASNLHSFTPSVGNTLGGCTSNWHSLTSALATRSGAAPGLHSLGVRQHARGLRLTFIRPTLATR
jgi:hypothetical protein